MIVDEPISRLGPRYASDTVQRTVLSSVSRYSGNSRAVIWVAIGSRAGSLQRLPVGFNMTSFWMGSDIVRPRCDCRRFRENYSIGKPISAFTMFADVGTTPDAINGGLRQCLSQLA
jgi:hypothetical protein